MRSWRTFVFHPLALLMGKRLELFDNVGFIAYRRKVESVPVGLGSIGSALLRSPLLLP